MTVESKTIATTLKDIGRTLDIEKITDDTCSILTGHTNNGEHMTIIVTQLGRMCSGVKDMVDPNYNTKWRGVITVVFAVRELVPILGVLAKECAIFVSSVLGFVGGGKTMGRAEGAVSGAGNGSTEDMLRQVICNALMSQRNKTLKANADSVCRLLMFSHNVLIGFSSKPDKHASDQEISDLLSLVDINAGIKALGEIESCIRSLMEESPRTESEEELSEYSHRVIQYMDMYCHLAVIRDAVMWELYSLLCYTGHHDRLANGIHKGLEGEHERDRNLVKSLVLPNQQQVLVASLFDGDRWPFTYTFMKECQLFDAIPNLNGVPVAMNTIKWMNWFVTHDSTPNICLRTLKSSTEKPLNKRKHNFLLLKKDNSTCYYICPQGRQDMYVVMTGGDKKWVEVKSGTPGKDGEWNLFNIQDNDSLYMLATRRWPLHFLRMSESWFGWIQGRIGSFTDPSAHWIIQYNGSKV